MSSLDLEVRRYHRQVDLLRAVGGPEKKGAVLSQVGPAGALDFREVVTKTKDLHHKILKSLESQDFQGSAIG